MGLETGDFIPDLVDTNPGGTDPKSEGDDHLRLIKRCTQGSFPAFVGTIADPKSVSLTEDELSDAAQKLADEIISGEWTHEADLFLGALIQLRGVSIPLIGQNAANFCEVGSDIVRTQLLGSDAVDNFVNSILVARATGTATGGFLVADRLSTLRKAGFRNPGTRNVGSTQAITQNDEDRILYFSTFNVPISLPALEQGTTVRFINPSVGGGSNRLVESGTTINTYLGGATFSGDVLIAEDSVCEIYYRTTTEISCFGNGLSPF